MKLDKVIRLNVILLREKRGWSQDDLAIQLGKSRSFVALLESGKRGIKTEHLQLLSETFNVTIDYMCEKHIQMNEDLQQNVSIKEEAIVAGLQDNRLNNYKNEYNFQADSVYKYFNLGFTLDTDWYEDGRINLIEAEQSCLSATYNPKEETIVYISEVDGDEETFFVYNEALENFIRRSSELKLKEMAIEKKLLEHNGLEELIAKLNDNLSDREKDVLLNDWEINNLSTSLDMEMSHEDKESMKSSKDTIVAMRRKYNLKGKDKLDHLLEGEIVEKLKFIYEKLEKLSKGYKIKAVSYFENDDKNKAEYEFRRSYNIDDVLSELEEIELRRLHDTADTRELTKALIQNLVELSTNNDGVNGVLSLMEEMNLR